MEKEIRRGRGTKKGRERRERERGREREREAWPALWKAVPEAHTR